MKLKRKLLAIICTSLLLSSTVFGADLEIPNLEDVFTYENVGDIADASYGKNTYMITQLGGVMVVHNTIGNGFVGTSDDWVPVLKNMMGDPLDNIVQLGIGDEGSVFLDANGHVWSTGNMIHPGTSSVSNHSDYAVRLNDWENIVQIAVNHHSNASYSVTVALNTEGRTFVTSPGFNGEALLGDKSRADFIKVFHTAGNGKVTAIDANTNLYVLDGSTWKPYKLKDGSQVTGVKKVMSGRGLDFVLRTDGSLFAISRDGTLQKIETPNKDYIYDVLDTATHGDHVPHLILKTPSGNYINDKSSITNFSKLNLDYNPVSIVQDTYDSNNYALLDDNGYMHLIGSAKAGKMLGFSDRGVTDSTKYRLPWMNDNPIIEDYVLAKFNIENNQVFDNKQNPVITFSMVTNTEPKSFNIYYTKSSDISDKSKWIKLESEIPCDNLSPTVYETGYTDNQQNEITGWTYGYEWQPGKGYIANVQFIVEPIY